MLQEERMAALTDSRSWSSMSMAVDMMGGAVVAVGQEDDWGGDSVLATSTEKGPLERVIR